MSQKYFFKKRLSLICVASFFLFFSLFSYAIGEDRLVIKNGSGDTVFNVQDDGMMTAIRGTYPVIQGERQTDLTTGARTVANFIHSTSGNMTDGFGPEFAFSIKDSGATEAICTVGAVRDGSDNSGAFAVWPRRFGAKIQALTVKSDGSLVMNNGATCTAAGVWEDASSRELKKDFRSLSTEEALTTLQQLKPIEFRYKKDDSDTHLGFVAEDVPQLVATKDRKHMSSMDVVALLTKVVQEQQLLIEKLSKDVKLLTKE